MTDSQDAPERIYRWDDTRDETVAYSEKQAIPTDFICRPTEYLRSDLAMERSEVEETVREALEIFNSGPITSDQPSVKRAKEKLESLLDEGEENDG